MTEKRQAGAGSSPFWDFSKKKKKTLIVVVGIVGGLFLLIGVFWFGRMSAKQKNQQGDEWRNGSSQSSKESKAFYFDFDNDYYIFDSVFPDMPKQDWKVFCVSKNHPRIKQLLSERKLRENKQFIFRYGKVDKEKKDLLIFNEFNQELKIIET